MHTADTPSSQAEPSALGPQVDVSALGTALPASRLLLVGPLGKTTLALELAADRRMLALSCGGGLRPYVGKSDVNIEVIETTGPLSALLEAFGDAAFQGRFDVVMVDGLDAMAPELMASAPDRARLLYALERCAAEGQAVIVTYATDNHPRRRSARSLRVALELLGDWAAAAIYCDVHGSPIYRIESLPGRVRGPAVLAPLLASRVDAVRLAALRALGTCSAGVSVEGK